MRRFKTGTPPRVNRRSIDFTGLEVQEGESHIIPFSFETEQALHNRVVCHLTYTNERNSSGHPAKICTVHPCIQGKIEGIGPRYCPSHRG